MTTTMAVLLLSTTWVAMSLIFGMLVEYRAKIAAALHFQPMPNEQRYRAGQPVKRKDR